MSARILLEVTLRILGLWFIFTSVNTLTTTVSFYWSGGWGASVGADMTSIVIAHCVSIAVQVAIGLGLIVCAPSMAARFYREEADAGESPVRVGPGDIYHTACFVLGAFVLINTAAPLGRLVIARFRGIDQGWMANDIFTIVVHTAAGILLIFGSRRISELMSSLRHDPESIPKQRLGVSNLLTLIVFFGLLIGVIRWLTLE